MMEHWNNDEVEKGLMIVIPAPYQVRGKLQPESSRSPGERREPF
jgi:hypothetical protein